MSSNAAQLDSVQQVELFIGGQYVPSSSGNYFDDRNPEDDSVFARAAHGNAEDVDRAVQCAQDAFASYRQTLACQREEWLLKAAQLLERDQNEFIEIIIAEGGSPYNKAAFEINLGVTYLRAAAGAGRRATGETIPSEIPGRFSMSVRSPLGVVGCITPFNVPLGKAIKLSSVALSTGNTVVLLASEEAPVLAARVAQLYQEAGLPDGAFNVITGFGHEIGDSLTSHPLVRLINFTGSSRVGKHIAEIAGKQMKRTILELGGKNPLIVLADADLAQAVQGATISMFMYQGQACMAASRIFVERPIFDEFVSHYKAAAESLGMGDLHDPTTILGPIISDRQRERVRSHIKDAVDKGATLVTGGNWTGNRCHPTILTDVKAGMTCFKEETFGPVTAIYPIDSAEEALALANDTVYGLSAAVYTSDINKALVLAQGIEAGMVHINAPSLHDEPNVPFGGVGDSGFGREGTEVDIDTTTEWKWITIQLPGAEVGH
jgi:acyl-CoA reductase-like NAD-dependent aldehyde dehydrogenase